MKRLGIFTSVVVLALGGIAYAQQYPMVDMIANKVVQKYQSSSCEQLMQNRGKSGNPEEERILNFLRKDAGARQEFFNRIAGPVMNKMFECGMLP